MNNIEQMFYDAWQAESNYPKNELCCEHSLIPQIVIGIYRVDFVADDNVVIEIDGHDYHKTKEQRESDYKRERYLMRKGFTVIRFTGTEVYLSPNECALEALRIADDYIMRYDYSQAMACASCKSKK